MALEESKLPLMPRTNVLKNTQVQQCRTAGLRNLTRVKCAPNRDTTGGKTWARTVPSA